jgi:hypothetical protein
MASKACGQNEAGDTLLSGCNLDGDWSRKRLAKKHEPTVREALRDMCGQVIVSKRLVVRERDHENRAERGEAFN